MVNPIRHILTIFTAFICMACVQNKHIAVYELDAFTPENVLQAVIEIPAGSNAKIEYNSITKTFENDQIDGQDRIIKYLPYPGNYGFIPGTFSDPKTGGDGDALDILVLSPSLPTGTVLQVIPIGVMKLLDNGETDYKIIAIPAEENLQTIQAATLLDLEKSYPQIKEIVTAWFLNYNPNDPSQNLGWENEKKALAEIQKSIRDN